MSETPAAARGKRRPPAYFQLQGTSLVKDLLAGADAVAGRSFLGAGGKTSGPLPPAQVPVSAPPGSLAPPGPEEGQGPGRPPAVADGAADTAPSGVTPAGAPTPVPAAGPWAHGAVHTSYADVKLRSSQWRAHGFRIAPDVLARLKARVNSDRRTTGNPQLAIGHYVDAALRHMPAETSALITMAEEFGTGQLWDQERTQPSTYRVGRQAHALASGLKMQLQEADFGRRGTQVVSAGIESFLDALETEGPLRRPAGKG